MNYYISRYSITREYGGPEEGGWWWDRSVFEEVIATCDSEDRAQFVVQTLNAAEKTDQEERAGGHRPAGRFSVNGGADTRYFWEDSPRQMEDTETPTWC
jgi:hypothetical protein